MTKDFIEETMKEFEEGDYIGASPSDWNEDNIKGYNQSKEEFRNFLRSALQSQRTEMLSRLPEEKRAFKGSVLGKKEQFQAMSDEGWNAALTAVRESLSANQ